MYVGFQSLGMAAAVGPDFTQQMIELEAQKDASRNLKNFHGNRMQINPRHARRITSVRAEFGGIHGIGRIRNGARPVSRARGLKLLLSPGRERRNLAGKRGRIGLKSARVLRIPNAGQVPRIHAGFVLRGSRARVLLCGLPSFSGSGNANTIPIHKMERIMPPGIRRWPPMFTADSRSSWRLR